MFWRWFNEMIHISGYVSKDRQRRRHSNNIKRRNRIRNKMAKASRVKNR